MYNFYNYDPAMHAQLVLTEFYSYVLILILLTIKLNRHFCSHNSNHSVMSSIRLFRIIRTGPTGAMFL